MLHDTLRTPVSVAIAIKLSKMRTQPTNEAPAMILIHLRRPVVNEILSTNEPINYKSESLRSF